MRLRRGLIGPMSSLGIQNRHGSSEEDSKGRVKGVRRCNVVHPPRVWFGILAAAGFFGALGKPSVAPRWPQW